MRLSWLAILPLLTFPHYAYADMEYGPNYGENPTLVAPERNLIPTVKMAQIIGWKEGQTPVAHDGFKVNLFADKLEHPRNIYVLPNGDILVAETNSPSKKGKSGGVKEFITNLGKKYVGAAGGSADRITLLRDTDGDGRADLRTIFLSGLYSPYGIELVGDYLYVANTDSLVRFKYKQGQTEITDTPEKIVDLPSGAPNSHWTKNMIADPNGKYLYVSIGSNSNIGDNGMDKEENRAAILKVDIAKRDFTVYASGLRNPNGLAWEKSSNMLWTAVNERDLLGNDLVPDYMTGVKEGGFYGWPYSYFGQHVDERVKPQRPDLVAKAIKPDYAIGSHTASLGLEFYNGNKFAPHKTVVLIGQHGSWNRNPPSGYKVIYVPFKNGKPNGKPHDLLTGFLSKDGDAMGRPVDVAVDKSGNILVSDDGGDVIWRVTK